MSPRFATQPLFSVRTRLKEDIERFPWKDHWQLKVVSRGHEVLGRRLEDEAVGPAPQDHGQMLISTADFGSGLTSMINWLTLVEGTRWHRVDFSTPFLAGESWKALYEEARQRLSRTLISAKLVEREPEQTMFTWMLSSIGARDTVPGLILEVGESFPDELGRVLFPELRGAIETAQTLPPMLIVTERMNDIHSGEFSRLVTATAAARPAPLSRADLRSMLTGIPCDLERVVAACDMTTGGQPLLVNLFFARIEAEPGVDPQAVADKLVANPPMYAAQRWCRRLAELLSDPGFVLPRRSVNEMAKGYAWEGEDDMELMLRLYLSGWTRLDENGEGWRIRSDVHRQLAERVLRNTSAYLAEP
ncbi:hypothetical protein L6V77_26470 [Myxococcota bacterium]|nr:hypothetical protein [Myxococcota bacterium]